MTDTSGNPDGLSNEPLYPIQQPGKCSLSHSVTMSKSEEVCQVATTNKNTNTFLVMIKQFQITLCCLPDLDSFSLSLPYQFNANAW